MIEAYTPDCPLCRLVEDREILTSVIFEDERILVTYCVICRVPMAVLKAHRDGFTTSERDHVRRRFRDLLSENPLPIDDADPANILERYQVGGGERPDWVIDWEQRRIPYHAHCHLRPGSFPGTRRWERLFAERAKPLDSP